MVYNIYYNTAARVSSRLLCDKWCRMSFSGKKFRRVGHENIQEMLTAANASEHVDRLLNTTAPVFSFTRNPDSSFTFSLETGEKTLTTVFFLDVEHEQERRDGTKVKVTYSLEGEHVLRQVIRRPDGKVAKFKREFGERDAKMTISVEETDIQSTIFYELVE